MAIIAGFGGRISIGSVNLKAHHWSVDWKTDEHDISVFENVGFGSYLGGLQDADITFDAYFDTVDNPFSNPIVLTPGLYDAIKITYIKGNATLVWNFPNVMCVSVHSETGVRDVIRYTYTGKLSGYTPTTGMDTGSSNLSPPTD